MSKRFQFLQKGDMEHMVHSRVDNNYILLVQWVLRSISYAIIMTGGLFLCAYGMQPKAGSTIALKSRHPHFSDSSSSLSIMPDPACLSEEQDKSFTYSANHVPKSKASANTSRAQRRACGILKRRFTWKKCPQCPFACKERTPFLQHIYEHSPVVIKCPVDKCDHKAKYINTLARHLKTEHEEQVRGASCIDLAAESYKKALEESRAGKVIQH